MSEPEVELFSPSSSFYLIGNIPESLHSADLRSFFSSLVEGGAFTCFHYKHRPEHTKGDPENTKGDPEHTKSEPEHTKGEPEHTKGDRASENTTSTKCCVIVLKTGTEEEKSFIKSYSNKNWVDSNGDVLPSRSRIQRLLVTGDSIDTSGTDPPHTAIPWSELRPLPEMNPPTVMPRGNVGTPLQTFMDLIRSCKLPSHVIKKLRLEFPKSRTSHRYGAVRLDYGNYGNRVGDGECSRKRGRQNRKDDEDDSDESDTIPPDDDHDAEEWERYESLHDDVDKQGRTKERLFEEELEVVWEKGGSGLVFYTDSAYWQEQEGDFDEQCSKEDDWDVDTSVYYNKGKGGSRDATALRDMTMERRLREGKDDGVSWRGVAGFERHTKGFGSRLLKKSGWKEGEGVGMSRQGMASPLEVEGQLPTVKKGLGYRGEKLDRHAPKRKRPLTRDVTISTVYDKPSEQEDTALRSAPVSTLKYREFLTGGLLHPETS